VSDITVTTDIHAPIESCFDLARDIGFHQHSLEHTHERAIAGRTDGLIELGESVTWEAKHLCLTRRMTVKITAMDRPTHFRDEQTGGPFKRFEHDHTFERIDENTTRMRDVVTFSSPFWLVGQSVDRVYLARYVKQMIQRRCLVIKAAAEQARQHA